MKLLSLMIVALLVVGCEKGRTTDSAVKLSADESAMLASLPGGNVVLAGGNYVRLQKFMSDSPLNRLMGQAIPSLGTAMKEWMNCFIEAKNVQMLSGAKVVGNIVEMRSVMKGMDMAQLQACATRAGFPIAMDADHKFLGIEMPNPVAPMKIGYLEVAAGMLYTRMSLQLPMTTVVSVDRATLEADIASIAKIGNAASDKALVSLLGTVDRTKAMWFVGSAAGTSAADKIGTGHGTIDMSDGMAFDFTMQVVDKELATNIASSVPKAKQQAGSLGGAVARVMDKLDFSRSDDRLRFRLAVSNADLNAIVDQLAPFAKTAP